MKPKIFWTTAEAAAVIAEAKRLRAADPAAQIKTICAEALLALPADRRKSTKSANYKMLINRVCGQRQKLPTTQPAGTKSPAARAARADFSARPTAKAVARTTAPNDFSALTLDEAADLFIDTLYRRLEARFAARLASAGLPVERASSSLPDKPVSKLEARSTRTPRAMTDDELKAAIVAAQKTGDRLTILRCTGELRRRDLAAAAIERGSEEEA
jgi:hypothetical protein